MAVLVPTTVRAYVFRNLSATAPTAGGPLSATFQVELEQGYLNRSPGSVTALLTQNEGGQAIVVARFSTASVTAFGGFQTVTVRTTVPSSLAGKRGTIWVGPTSLLSTVSIGSNILAVIRRQLLSGGTGLVAGAPPTYTPPASGTQPTSGTPPTSGSSTTTAAPHISPWVWVGIGGGALLLGGVAVAML